MSTGRRVEARLPEVGECVAGRYRIVRLIGEGGFSAVYLASDERAGGQLALKVLAPQKSVDSHFASRFRQEANVARNLRHHNTVKIWDVGETDSGCLFMAMEFLDGQPLSRVIEREAPLPSDRCRHIAKQVLRSLAEAHKIGIIHRDLKPDNIMVRQMLDEPDYVTVLDFGIAKAFGDLAMTETQTGMSLFTPAYASPELLRARGVTPAADVYAFGLVLIEMLSGQRAIPGDTTADVLFHQMSPDPVAIPIAVEQSPLGEAIRRAVQKDPAHRFQSASEWLTDLSGPIAGVRASQEQPAATQPAPRHTAPQAPVAPVLPGPGDWVAGRYRLDSLLGEGGFARVYLAHDQTTSRMVAVKVIDPHRSDDDIVQRFEQEFAVVRRLDHPNTISVWDAGRTSGGALFMVMEVVEGRPLDEVAAELGGPLPPERVIAIARQVLGSLGEAHALGVVHRDLKPANIMLGVRQGVDHVTVLDFGIAKALEPALAMVKTATGMVMCTPRYAAPELLRQQGIGPYTDLYALGLMMLELLTGTPAVRGGSVGEIVAAQIHPAPITMPDGLVQTPLGQIVRRATAKTVSERYPTAEAMGQALADLDVRSRPAVALPGAMVGPVSPDSPAQQQALVGRNTIAVGETPSALAKSGGRGTAMLLGGLAVAALVAVAVFFFMTRGPESVPLTAIDGHLAAGEWSDASQLMDAVDPEHPGYAALDERRERVRAEVAVETRYNALVAAFEAEDMATVMERLDDIPEDSFYRTHITEIEQAAHQWRDTPGTIEITPTVDARVILGMDERTVGANQVARFDVAPGESHTVRVEALWYESASHTTEVGPGETASRTVRLTRLPADQYVPEGHRLIEVGRSNEALALFLQACEAGNVGGCDRWSIALHNDDPDNGGFFRGNPPIEAGCREHQSRGSCEVALQIGRELESTQPENAARMYRMACTQRPADWEYDCARFWEILFTGYLNLGSSPSPWELDQEAAEEQLVIRCRLGQSLACDKLGFVLAFPARGETGLTCVNRIMGDFDILYELCMEEDVASVCSSIHNGLHTFNEYSGFDCNSSRTNWDRLERWQNRELDALRHGCELDDRASCGYAAFCHHYGYCGARQSRSRRSEYAERACSLGDTGYCDADENGTPDILEL